MTPLEIDAAFADVFHTLDALKAENTSLAQALQGQREEVLRLKEQVAVLQAHEAEEKDEPPVVNVTSPAVSVTVPTPIVNNTIVMPPEVEQADKKLRVTYTDYQGTKKIMEIETVR
jgi:hypothetical protein